MNRRRAPFWVTLTVSAPGTLGDMRRLSAEPTDRLWSVDFGVYFDLFTGRPFL